MRAMMPQGSGLHIQTQALVEAIKTFRVHSKTVSFALTARAVLTPILVVPQEIATPKVACPLALVAHVRCGRTILKKYNLWQVQVVASPGLIMYGLAHSG
jgi:hypothetical protein